MEYIATFFTHFGAMSFKRKLERAGYKPLMQSVPRSLSSSCGSCIRFKGEFDPSLADDDLEGVYLCAETGYTSVYTHEESE